MMKILEEPVWGVMIIEDTETLELYFQCVCGGVGMYWECVKMTDDEAVEVRNGKFEYEKMILDVCHQNLRVNNRRVPAFKLDDLKKT